MDEAPRSEQPTHTQRGADSQPWRARLARRLRSVFRVRRLYFLRAQIRFAPTEAQRLFALTIIIGVVCGFAAVAFHLSIRLLEKLLIENSMEAPGNSWIFWTVATPLLGSLLCGILLQFVFPNARGSGIPQVKVAFAKAGGRLRMRDSVGKFLVGSIQLGTGSSLGREGPTVQICAGIASLLGRITGVSPKSLRRLLPVGAAAGIAAAFNAPIAAVTFTIEEVVGNLDQAVLSGVIVAAALSAVIERAVLGEHAVFELPQNYGLQHPSSLLIYAAIGVAAAVVSVIFSESLLRLRLVFRRSSLPLWAQPAIGGLVTGALAVFALGFLGNSGVTGGGYETLSQALMGKLAVKVMLVLCVLKVAATVFSYASGGAGGIFAPALFIGGTLGGAMGNLDAYLLGHEGEPIGAFALVGMGAVFSGIIRAPMTSVLIIVEMTSGYSLILPLMIANMTAYILARSFRHVPIYDALLAQDGIHLEENAVADSFEGVRIDSLMNLKQQFTTFLPATSAYEVKRQVAEADRQDVYPVLDKEGCLLGMITGEELRVLKDEPELLKLTNALDLMRPAVIVRPEDELRVALELMVKNGIRDIPVASPEGRFLGFVEETAVARAYVRRQTKRPESLPPPAPEAL